MFKKYSKFLVIPVALVAMVVSGCSLGSNAIDGIMRELGKTPGTFYNYGADGQIVFQANCASLDFQRDSKFDRLNGKGEKIKDGSVVSISCGDNILSTVGFTSVYISGNIQQAFFADAQKFANLRIKNNDRGIPLVNFAWRDVKNTFVGTASVVQLSDQNNNAILAFACDEMVSYATDVDKSTMFQCTFHKQRGYIWIYRGSYLTADTALLNNSQL